MEGGIDISVALRLGVYLLRRSGRVVFIGKSRCPIAAIAAHRSLARTHTPAWLPIKGIVFDAVEVIPAHPDRVDALVRGLVDLYLPIHNPRPSAQTGEVAPVLPISPVPESFQARRL